MEYEIKEMTINKDNIKKFQAIEGARSLRKTQVERIEKSIRKREMEGFGVIYLNLKEEIFRIIDGNHRITAVRNLIENKAISSLNITCAIYRSLDKANEKRIYDILARQINQTTEDFLNLHKDEFPLWKIINEKSFPVKIGVYGGKNILKFKYLISLLSVARSKSFEQGVTIRRKEELQEIAVHTNEGSYRELSEFFKVFLAAYGDPGNENRFSKIQVLIPLYHIWYTNRTRNKKGVYNFEEKLKWVKYFERIMANPEINLYSQERINRDTMPRIRALMIDLMRPRNKESTKFTKFK